jgi:hypothetical protein
MLAIDAMIAHEVALATAAAMAEPHEAPGRELLAMANGLLIAASTFADPRLGRQE